MSYVPLSANSFSGLFSPDTNNPANPNLIHQQQTNQLRNQQQQQQQPQPSHFSARLANTFGTFNAFQPTFEKFTNLPAKNVFTRTSNPQVSNRNASVLSSNSPSQQSPAANFYRYNTNFNTNTLSGVQTSANFSLPQQIRLPVSDSPNYIQLAAEKVASFLNAEAPSTFRNPFSANLFGSAPASSGIQRSVWSRTTGNLSGTPGGSGEHPGKVTPSMSMGLTNQQLREMQSAQTFGQPSHAPVTQANPAIYYHPNMVPQGNLTHTGNLNPQIQLTQPIPQANRGHLDSTGSIFVGMPPGQQSLQQGNSSALNQFARKPTHNILTPQGTQFTTQLGNMANPGTYGTQQQIGGYPGTIQVGTTPAQLEAEQRFRRSQQQQVQTSKLNPTPYLGLNTNSNIANVPQLGGNGLSGSYQSVFSDSQLNQTFQPFQNPVQGSILNPSDALGTLQRQNPMYLSMDGGLNLINEQKNNELQMQQQNILSAIERSRGLDRLSVEQLYNQQRSRSLDQSEPLVPSPSLAGTVPAAPTLQATSSLSLQNSQINSTSRFPQFPVDLAHRLHAQHATGYQVPAEFSKRSSLDSGFRSLDPQLIKSGLDQSVPQKSVSFNVNQNSTPTHSSVQASLTKLSELFPDCAECRRLEENRRLFRTSLKLRSNPSESWSDYMKENDRFISSQDEDSLRKLAKMVSATFSGDSDSADSEGRFTRGYATSASDYPYTSRYPSENANKLGHGFGSARSLPSAYVDQLESSLVRGALDSPGSLRSRKTSSLSEVDMQRRLDLERDLLRPSRSRAPSQDYLANTEYAKAAAYAAELNQKLGAFTAEMENLSLDRSKLRGRSRDRKSNEKDRRMSSRDNTLRERSKSRTLEDSAAAAQRLRSASPEHAKMSRRLDRIGKSARDYSPVGIAATNYGDSYIGDGFSSIQRARNRSSSKTRVAHDEVSENYPTPRRRLGSNKDRGTFPDEELLRKKPTRDRNRESRRGSFYESRPHDRRFGVRDACESSSSSIDRLSSPDRRNRKSGTYLPGQSYDSQRVGSRDRSSYRDRDRLYERTLELDKSRRLPEVPGNNNYSNESGYSSQSQRATRDDNERNARNNSSNHRDSTTMFKHSNQATSRDNRSGYLAENDYHYQNSGNYHNGNPQFNAGTHNNYHQNSQSQYSNQYQQGSYGGGNYSQDTGNMPAQSYGYNANSSEPYNRQNNGTNYTNMHVNNNINSSNNSSGYNNNQNQSYQQHLQAGNSSNTGNNQFMNQQQRSATPQNYYPAVNHNNSSNTFNNNNNNNNNNMNNNNINNQSGNVGGVMASVPGGNNMMGGAVSMQNNQMLNQNNSSMNNSNTGHVMGGGGVNNQGGQMGAR